MKATSSMISHSFTIGFSLFLIFVIILTLNHLEDEYRSFAGKNEIMQVCGIIQYGAEKIYNPTNYTSQTNTTMGRIELMLPKKIAGITYRAKFINNSIYISTLAKPFFNTTCELNINATFSGSIKGGETEVIWTRRSNKEDEITMRMVNA